MSSAARALSGGKVRGRKQRRHASGGYFKCPNSLAEAGSLLTPAELRFAIIVHRRDPGDPITDATWLKWSGLDWRTKQNAIRGLRDKGLEVEGTGEKATYTWNHHRWSEYVRTAPREVETRTAGRAPSKPPEPKLHPRCAASGGCALLEDDPQGGAVRPQNALVNLPTFVEEKEVARNVAQPVAQPISPAATDDEAKLQPSDAGIPASGGGDEEAKLGKERKGTEPQPDEGRWTHTLAALRKFFPYIGVAFLVTLLAACRRLCGVVEDDEELARAVKNAGATKAGRQESEGLFVLTVPEVLRAMRAERAPPTEEDPQRAQALRLWGPHLARCVEVLRVRPEHVGHANKIQHAAGRLKPSTFDEIWREMEELQHRIISAAQQALPNEVADALVARVLVESKELGDLAPYFEREEWLKAAGLPDLLEYLNPTRVLT